MAQYKVHIVNKDERWDSIAWEEYGNVSLTPTIQLANPEIPLDIKIPAGTVLRIPILEVVETQIELLPPWKR